MKTLLVVEDEKMIRRGICTIAKRSGVEIEEILECSNGEEALEIVKEDDSVTFEVEASGIGLTYQWYKGSEIINGALRSALCFSSLK